MSVYGCCNEKEKELTCSTDVPCSVFMRQERTSQHWPRLRGDHAEKTKRQSVTQLSNHNLMTQKTFLCVQTAKHFISLLNTAFIHVPNVLDLMSLVPSYPTVHVHSLSIRLPSLINNFLLMSGAHASPLPVRSSYSVTPLRVVSIFSSFRLSVKSRHRSSELVSVPHGHPIPRR